MSAMNDWQAQEFVDPEPRLRASILVPAEDPPAAVREIEKRAGDWRFCQIQLGSKTPSRRAAAILADLRGRAATRFLHWSAHRRHDDQCAVAGRMAAVLH